MSKTTYITQLLPIALIITEVITSKLNPSLSIHPSYLVALLGLMGFQYFISERSYGAKVKKEVSAQVEELKKLTDKTYRDFAKVIEDRDKHVSDKIEVLDNRISKLDI